MILSRRNFLAGAGLATLAWRSNLLHALTGAAPTTQQIPLGLLRGELAHGVRVFRGVPYAEPPVRSLRFHAPEPVKPWKGLRDATHFAAAATQSGVHFPTSEDCLYLNIWTPAAKGVFPVFVWIHGGGFTSGRAHDPMFDGSIFAQAGIVCVTITYRLGILGFLNIEPILGSAYEGGANNGLRDLALALSWIHDNIADFSGDPTRVTIGGQSAGAKLTDLLMAAPSARNHFHQMISESGGADRYNSRTESERIAEGFASTWKSMKYERRELLTAQPDELMDAQARFMAEWPKHFPLRAMIDGHLLPRIPLETIAAGNTRTKRLLLGTCRDEAVSFIGPHPDRDPSAGNVGNVPIDSFLAIYRKYKEIYPQMSDEQRRLHALTAEEYWVPSMRVAEAHERAGGAAWVYRLDFAETTGKMRGFAPHSSDVKLVWNRPSSMAGNAADEARLARQVHSAWIEFLNGEQPAAAGLPVWPQFTAKKRATMIFDSHSHVDDRPGEAELKLWERAL